MGFGASARHWKHGFGAPHSIRKMENGAGVGQNVGATFCPQLCLLLLPAFGAWSITGATSGYMPRGTEPCDMCVTGSSGTFCTTVAQLFRLLVSGISSGYTCGR